MNGAEARGDAEVWAGGSREMLRAHLKLLLLFLLLLLL